VQWPTIVITRCVSPRAAIGGLEAGNLARPRAIEETSKQRSSEAVQVDRFEQSVSSAVPMSYSVIRGVAQEVADHEGDCDGTGQDDGERFLASEFAQFCNNDCGTLGPAGHLAGRQSLDGSEFSDHSEPDPAGIGGGISCEVHDDGGVGEIDLMNLDGHLSAPLEPFGHFLEPCDDADGGASDCKSESDYVGHVSISERSSLLRLISLSLGFSVSISNRLL